MAHFDLLHDRAAIRVLIFDRVFNGNDVIAPLGVDQVEQRGEGRSLAASRRTGKQDKPLPPFG